MHTCPRSLVLPCSCKRLQRHQPCACARRRPQVRASGLVVNSMGWIVELGYELIKHTVQVGAAGGWFGACVWPPAPAAVPAAGGAASLSCRVRPLRHARGSTPPPHSVAHVPPAPLQALKCSVVLVVGDERLYSQLSGDLRKADSSIAVRFRCRGLRGGVEVGLGGVE